MRLCPTEVASAPIRNNGGPRVTRPVLLVTRPEPEASAFAREMGHVPVVLSPLQRIEAVAVELPREIRGLLLTSPRGAQATGPLPLDRALTAWCTGDRTAEAARQAGFEARSAAGDAEALLDLILSERPAGPLLHLRGEQARGDLAARLTVAGIPCEERVAYRQLAQQLGADARHALSGANPVVAPLFSPRTAALLAEAAPFAAPLHVVAMSSAVAGAAAPLAPASLAVADRPDAGSMVTATRAAIRRVESDGARL